MTKRKEAKSQNEKKLWGDRPFSKTLAWRYLVKMARRVETDWNVKGRKFNLQRGQLHCRKSDLAKRWGWTRLKVQRFFKKLEKEGMITQELFEGVGTIVTIVDLDKAMKEFFV